jgi:hypothetical protein
MNLTKLTNQELHENTKRLAHNERELTLKILHHLKEIERRRYHLELGYGDLYKYCSGELKYSGGSAHRRINAMKLLKELPELEVKIETGELTLTNIAQAQTFFNSQSKDSNQKCEIEDKKEILKNLENKSTREAERTLLQLSPESLPKERLRQLTEDKMELRLILDQETKEALDKIKALLSHRHKNLSMGELGLAPRIVELRG